MSSLKIYFSICNERLEINYTIHRDIITLRELWESKITNSNWLFSIIHVGYDIPNYNINHVIEIIDNIPDITKPVFITESAKWSLPYKYSICTNDPLFTTEFEARDHRIPIYLILNEWGYEHNYQPSLNIHPSPTVYNDIHATGWVKELSIINNGLGHELLSHGIAKEEDYIKHKKRLTSETIIHIDNFRYNYLFNRLDCPNLFTILQILPEWLLKCSIDEIGLSVRTYFSLKRNQITRLNDLTTSKYNKVFLDSNNESSITNSIIQSINYTYKNYKDDASFFKEVASGVMSKVDEYDDVTPGFYNYIYTKFNSLPEKRRKILATRLGFDGTRPLTLKEVGDSNGYSRERIRQIENRYFPKIFSRIILDNHVIPKIEKLLENRDKPLILDLLIIEDDWFCGFSTNVKCLEEIIDRFCKPSSTYNRIRRV